MPDGSSGNCGSLRLAVRRSCVEVEFMADYALFLFCAWLSAASRDKFAAETGVRIDAQALPRSLLTETLRPRGCPSLGCPPTARDQEGHDPEHTITEAIPYWKLRGCGAAPSHCHLVPMATRMRGKHNQLGSSKAPQRMELGGFSRHTFATGMARHCGNPAELRFQEECDKKTMISSDLSMISRRTGYIALLTMLQEMN